MFGASEEMRIEHLQNNAMELVHTLCSIIAQPVEVALRPAYGTRYYAVPVTFFSAAMMLILPGIIMLFSNFMHMIPLLNIPPTPGMFGLGDYAKVYFLIMAVHGVRLWRRMIHMENEIHSEYEGPALPFFQILPKGKSFGFVRIVLEPLLVLIVSIVLKDLFIAQPDLALYLKLAALALAVKGFIAWFRSWEFMRITIDTRNAAPVLAKLMDDQATEAELEPLHLASLPKNIDPEIRKATIAHIARNYMQE
ncbi:hypothetical protein [Tunturiibacter gelidoferens]|uniref:Uncharacterized protein n=1 Tax=Tunturiibacter lichenicola TaxID=2051959 RepID=A0A7Y9NN56_9BACT|nr:hypothetical protein [Edaphobacter lichenicola]NYF52450.1 hypothetical protein [Edaphobacter lichenicola]